MAVPWGLVVSAIPDRKTGRDDRQKYFPTATIKKNTYIQITAPVTTQTIASEERTLLPKREQHSTSETRSTTMWWRTRSLRLDALMVFWGLGTWLGVNGLFVQLPLLVERLPEGWALPSSIVLAIQVANVGMLAYIALKRLRPRASDAPYVAGLLALGAAALALNAFLYEHTAPLGGRERSVAFLVLTFCAALVGCTSSVLFYPYLRHFRAAYLYTYLAGEGLSGFVPGALALVQGVGGEPNCLPSDDGTVLVPHYPPPRFDTTVFMLVLAALSALSLFSFLILDNWSGFASERVVASAADQSAEKEPQMSLRARRWLCIFALTATLNALSNGVLPSVQSYSCMPYGAVTYHLAVSLAAMANPIVCLAGVWLPPVSARVLAAMLACATLPLAYVLATAALSPLPPLQTQGAGPTLVVVAWVAISAIISYARMWVYAVCRGGGACAMRACGASTQTRRRAPPPPPPAPPSRRSSRTHATATDLRTTPGSGCTIISRGSACYQLSVCGFARVCMGSVYSSSILINLAGNPNLSPALNSDHALALDSASRTAFNFGFVPVQFGSNLDEAGLRGMWIKPWLIQLIKRLLHSCTEQVEKQFRSRTQLECNH
ncbi:Riboflavin transporter 2 [Eumeta japonica]|uniref:Riboflavin transporter 2 n=1 Tax=Eumeta variegata TaxID=151549 RepID=A0A4C1YUJ0_EUMVA|nr:Riboflavin transporter 2 [Eumeta japonica]